MNQTSNVKDGVNIDNFTQHRFLLGDFHAIHMRSVSTLYLVPGTYGTAVPVLYRKLARKFIFFIFFSSKTSRWILFLIELKFE